MLSVLSNVPYTQSWSAKIDANHSEMNRTSILQKCFTSALLSTYL